MNTLALIGKELLGMFVGDNKLALYVLAVVALAAVCAFALHAGALATGAVLALGCAAVLVESVLRAGRG
jgi:hypothetical protein